MTKTPARRIIALVGPSGTGKTSIMDILVSKGLLVKPTSHATRPMRAGEVQGNPYHFVSPSEFEGLDKEGAFIEKVVYGGNRYGFTRGEVDRALGRGDVGLIVDGHGALQFSRIYGNDVKVIFLNPPPKSELIKRMAGRGDTMDQIQSRLNLVESEMRSMILAHWMVNTDMPLDDVVHTVETLIQYDKLRRHGHYAPMRRDGYHVDQVLTDSLGRVMGL